MRTVAILAGRQPEHRYSLQRGYVDAVWALGATPIMLTPPPADVPLDGFLEVVIGCDGLLISGGGDVDPRAYGEEPAVPLMELDPDRDRGEIAALHAARAAGRPVLGICRGVQLLAVALGGALHQDLAVAGFGTRHWEEERQHEPVHPIVADPGSLAARALGGTSTVNSIHHQAVRDPGSTLTATAWSDDGVIEAVEGDGLLGVQWHPERLAHLDARHLAPFAWLLEAAA
jgi:putative glutamine amidotransferase